MKIFYGVQGTGNGHIARARMMAKELELAGIETTFLFSGRATDGYFDMDVFKDYQLRTGLTFITNHGEDRKKEGPPRRWRAAAFAGAIPGRSVKAQ